MDKLLMPGLLLVLFKPILGVPAALPWRAGRLGGPPAGPPPGVA
jgi:hypothetical protein